MPISSFYGLQTSLRGLLAQQRLLDTTGHNIANASTQGLLAPGGHARRLAGARDPRGRHRRRRRRPPRLGRRRAVLPPHPRPVRRPPVPRPEHQPRRVEGARRPRSTRPRARSPSRARTASTSSSAEFWDAWSDLANANGTDLGAAKQAVVEKGAVAGRRVQDRPRADRPGQGRRPTREYSDLARPASAGDPGGEIAQIARDIAELNDTIKRFVTAGDVPNDLLDRRDLLLDQLSEYGQVSVDGAVRRHDQRQLRRQASRPARPTRSSPARPPRGPARRPATPGRPAAASAACSTPPSPAARSTAT